MKAPYPKKPEEIKVRIINRAIHDGQVSTIQTTAEVMLSDKLSDYVVRLGYSSTNLIGFVVQLFNNGKVRIDFSSHTERLELVNASDRLSGAQAISLLEDYLASLEAAGALDRISKDDDQTQNIVVPSPKPFKVSVKV